MTAFGGIESGGSKWECAIGTAPDDLRATETIPTTSPGETIERAVAFFEREERVEAIGIGSFGPVDLRPGSATWGYITTTPKEGWDNTDVAQEIGRRLSVPVAFDTDVNAAALGEHRWGAAQGVDTFCYLTVGTGIGGGGMAAGKLLHGLLHPEFGHMRIPHDRDADPFPGACPYHGDCWERLASGRAMEERWGGSSRPATSRSASSRMIYVRSPERILIGGGVMKQPGLLERVRGEVAALMNGYLDAAAGADDYIALPALGTRAGVLGAIALAETASR